MNTDSWREEVWEDAGVPTMLSAEERRYLHWLARAAWSDVGHVVEIGPWLGGSTVCLAAGMAARSTAPRHRLHTFDDCVWRAFMSERAPLSLAPGESFEAELRRNLAEHAERVQVHVAQLPDEAIPGDADAEERREAGRGASPPFLWERGEPIEILFIDGAKSWRAMRHLLASVHRDLVPGASLLVCQDYKYWGCYWVPMLLERLSGSLELVHDVLGGDTVAFRVRDRLPGDEIESLAADVHSASAPTALADLDAAASRLRRAGDRAAGYRLALGRVAFLAHRGELDAACAEFEKAQDAWPLGLSPNQLERARRYLREVRAREVPKRRALRVAQRARHALARLRRSVP